MTTARHGAAHILQKQGRMTAMKLQTLVYYSHVWSIVWDGARMFPEPVEAWVDGPVVRDLFEKHRGRLWIEPSDLEPKETLAARQRQTLAAVLKFYGPKDAEWLSQLSHREAPWADARSGLSGRARSAAEIKDSAVRAYYGKVPRPPSGKGFSLAYQRGVEILANMPPDEVDGLARDAEIPAADVVRRLRATKGSAGCARSS